MKNKEKRCIGCHNEIEEEYFFCSITCKCLCGFMNVRSDIKPKRTMEELSDPVVIKAFLNNPPVRGNYPDKEKWA